MEQFELKISKNCNQALELARFSLQFVNGNVGAGPSKQVIDRVELYFADSVFCGASALALRTNAPILFREEALEDYIIGSHDNR